jgi:acetyltransferase-like isoleucine patch superfamily enzyme
LQRAIEHTTWLVQKLRIASQQYAVESELRGRAPDLSIGQNVQFANPAGIHFGERVVLADNAALLCAPAIGGLPSGRIMLGDEVRVGRNVRFSSSAGCRLAIGDGTTFFQNVVGIGDIRIGAGCIFSGNIYLGSDDHQIRRRPSWMIRDQDALAFAEDGDRTIAIGDDVWIGWGAVIRPGVTIGRGAVIGANAVVTHSVAPYSIVGGCPAMLLGQRLDFRPPRELSASDDEMLPYFYSGFFLRQRDLDVSRRDGIVWAGSESEIVLEGSGGGEVQIEGLVLPSVTYRIISILHNGTEIGRQSIGQGAFSIKAKISDVKNRDDIHPRACVLAIRIDAGSQKRVWGLSAARFVS